MLKKGMEELFKKNLLSLRQAPKPMTFGEALFPQSLWRPATGKRAVKVKSIIHEEYSEKKQVLESLERFAHEKVQETSNPVINIPGGTVVVKPEPSWSGISEFAVLSDLQKTLTLDQAMLNLLLQNKVSGKIQILFVTETFRPWDEVQKDLKEGFINELLAGFQPKTAELFERMIMAMKLTAEEVLLYPVESADIDLATEIMALATYFKPEVIVTLGAKATQKILKSNDRLSLVHGQFFKRSVDNYGSFQVVPLFHPSIIETNQNMKKTAWSDMQKIMRYLQKLT